MDTGHFLKNFIKRNSYNTVEVTIVNKGYIDNEVKKKRQKLGMTLARRQIVNQVMNGEI